MSGLLGPKRFWALFLLPLAAGCGFPASESAPSQVQLEQTEVASSPGAVESLWREQKLIRQAALQLQVENLEQSIRRIEEIALVHDGLVLDSEIRESQGARRASIKLRAPTASFEDAIQDLRQLGDIQRETVTTQDVTKAYADLELRLSTKRSIEARLRQLLASRSGDLSSVLEVERELGRVVGEIEELLGEQRYYDHQIATSLILLHLEEPSGLLGPGLTNPVRMALNQSFKVLGMSVAAMVYVAAFFTPWLLILIPVWWIVARIRRRNRASGTSAGRRRE